ncbi:peroxide stress protein YaaA [Piscinibacter sakaiensis]|uniref:peroxide stress protein YaaA n=1 Tax=Piscinibacter sakaiensis TaxID=1547922 RepID=UPI003AAF611B
MLFLLSPAKRLDYESPRRPLPVRRPAFVAEASELIEILRGQSAQQIAALMKLSPDLAELNVARYDAWRPRFTERNSRPAVLAFAGDVYGGLDAASLDDDELEWADQHLVILSGLYGALRPLDALQPYRLEMGTALPNRRGGNLHAYWGDLLAEHLNRRARAEASPVIVNLASQEYLGGVRLQRLKPRLVHCVFEDWKGDGYKVIGFFAKRARGLMARFAVSHRIETPGGLHGFDAEGYRYAGEVSTPDRLVFRRKEAA